MDRVYRDPWLVSGRFRTWWPRGGGAAGQSSGAGRRDRL